MDNKIALDFWSKTPKYKRKILQNVITDRKSKYTSVCWFIDTKDSVEQFMKDILKDKYFQKSSHNSFAYRFKQENWSIVEWKNDDGETWAWLCILRELQREEYVNIIVIITRYFWWIHLQSDRFKNVIEATKIILKQI